MWVGTVKAALNSTRMWTLLCNACGCGWGLQVLCYEDNKLLKLFKDIVKLLYNGDLVAEDTIQHWYKKGSHPKGRNVFLKVSPHDLAQGGHTPGGGVPCTILKSDALL